MIKKYINTLIIGYYTKVQTDASLLLKSDKLNTYSKTQTDNALALKQNSLIFPTIEGANGWGTIDSTGTVRRIVGSAPIMSFIELDVDNVSSINDIKIGLDMELSWLTNYYTKSQTDTNLLLK